MGVRKNIGATTMRINEVDEGLFDIPSQRLFMDFCRNLSKSYLTISFPALFFPSTRQETAVLVVQNRNSNGNVQRALAQSVVIAIGAPGKCNIPKISQSVCPRSCTTHTVILFDLERERERERRGNSLNVGGGLSAVQAEDQPIFKKESCSYENNSRRPLQWRHFDFPLEWFDRRKMGRKFFEFLEEKMENRPQFIKNAQRRWNCSLVVVN